MNVTGVFSRGRVTGALALLLVASVSPAAAVQQATNNTQHTTVATARQLLTRQAYADALDKLNAVLDKHPDNGEARFLKGLALAHSGQTEAALKLFEALTRDFPDMAEAWNNLGVLRARADDLAGARKALQEATALNPEHVAARQNLGDVYVALARQAYLEASALAPDNQIVRRKVHRLARLMQGGFAADSKRVARSGQSDGAGSNNTQPRAGATQPAAADADTTPTRVASVGVPKIAAATQQDAQAAVRAALRDWAAAWSAQDLGAYFAAYGQHFDPVGSRSIQQWRALRVRRVGNPDWISVEVSNIEVALTGSNTATVYFDQDYESGDYQDHVNKTVTMVHGDQGWVITSESS